MPEIRDGHKVFSLLEVTHSIENTLRQRYSSAFWVKAEMNKLNLYPHSGHCYPDLVEKNGGVVVAQIRANLWKDDYERINAAFVRVLKEPLKDGINIMFSAKISYSPVYGLALRILDIDLNYTLGTLEKEKQETIARLQEEGIFAQNKKLKLPVLPQRVAVISVSTSKGYADFVNVIENNPWGYRYFLMLFPALLQGERAAEDIGGQLDRIQKVMRHFDVVAIIRGGGGDVGLSCYNDFELAQKIARFPIPVLTGIGHSTNETVAEMVSRVNAITPTKLAEFLIQKFHDFAVPVKEARQRIIATVPVMIRVEEREFQHVHKHFFMVSRSYMERRTHALQQSGRKLHASCAGILQAMEGFLLQAPLSIVKSVSGNVRLQRQTITDNRSKLQAGLKSFMVHARAKLQLSETGVLLMDPKHVLKRGYSITLKNGKSIHSTALAEPGDIIETRLSDGSLISVVQNKK
jgi:exodeoxyribonuclease VII large subunit